jgi:type II secretory pathway component GspD/PulD (secretin)
MLILAPLEDANFPDELIETVTPQELDQRGKYETIICVFDLGELNPQEMFDELKPMVSQSNQNFFAQFPAANQIRVRETGGTLRIMRDLIESAKINKKKRLESFALRFIDAESFMLMARGQLGMAAGQNSSEDGSISITLEPFGRRLFVTATEAMHKRFTEVANAIDIPAEQDPSVQVKPQRFKQYPILVDPDLGRGMIEFVLDGRPGVKMEQDKENNSVMVWGTDEDHHLVEQALQAIAQVSGVAFEIIPLQHADAKSLLPAVQNLIGQSTLPTAEAKPDAPVLLADTEKNQIIVRGKSKDVEDIKRIVLRLDETAKSQSTGIRTDTRVISVDEQDAERLSELLPFLLEGEGRKNRVQVIMPKDRKDFRARNFRGNFRQLGSQDDTQMPGDSQDPDEPDNQERLNQPQSSNPKSIRVFGSGLFLASRFLGIASSTSGMTSMLVQEEQESADEKTKRSIDSQDYRPPKAIDSEPGAPIVARYVEGKLILSSKDLDALDDLVFAIERELGEKSSVESATVFPISHRSVNEVKATLEAIFGMASSSGGGDGTNPLGNLARNMVPGVGGLLDGLLSPDAGGSSTSELEGDVKFNVDVPLNYLFVSGATANDLDLITMYLEMIDQPNPAHSMDLVGRTYAIRIEHRDPEIVKQRIEELVPEYIDKTNAENQPQQNNEAVQMMRAMQALTGGKGNAGGGPEQKEAKARLSVDTERGYLIVTGPEHIYFKIKEIVSTLDIPSNEKPKKHFFLDRPPIDPETLRKMVEDRFPGIEFKLAGEEDSGSGSSGTGQATTGRSDSANRPNPAPNQDEMRARAMEMLNRMQQPRGDQSGRGERGGNQGGRGQRGGDQSNRDGVPSGRGGFPTRGGGIF